MEPILQFLSPIFEWVSSYWVLWGNWFYTLWPKWGAFWCPSAFFLSNLSILRLCPFMAFASYTNWIIWLLGGLLILGRLRKIFSETNLLDQVQSTNGWLLIYLISNNLKDSLGFIVLLLFLLATKCINSLSLFRFLI